MSRRMSTAAAMTSVSASTLALRVLCGRVFPWVGSLARRFCWTLTVEPHANIHECDNGCHTDYDWYRADVRKEAL